jgi:hypothetical protein
MEYCISRHVISWDFSLLVGIESSRWVGPRFPLGAFRASSGLKGTLSCFAL